MQDETHLEAAVQHEDQVAAAAQDENHVEAAVQHEEQVEASVQVANQVEAAVQDEKMLARLAALVRIASSADAEPRRIFFRVLAMELKAVACDPGVRDWYMANRAISMWSLEVLCAATILAALRDDPVLEIGTYIGGGTTALGRGSQISGGRVICIEKGGIHRDHPVIPSDDILSDLRTNIARFGVAEKITIIEGNYGDKLYLQSLAEILGKDKVGLLCIDADGHVDRAINFFAGCLADDALLIIDDYASPLHRDKSTLTQPTVDALCGMGYLEPWGLITGQTWFGQSRGLARLAAANRFITRMLSEEELGVPLGLGFAIRLPNSFAAMSDDITSNSSPLLFLEDRKLLGPPHYPFEIIKLEGRGCFVHWRENLWFSTSDNSDPRTNGRTYEVILGDEHLELILV